MRVIVILFFCFSFVQQGCMAQNNSPILFVVPSSPGTTGDQMARLIASKMTQRSGLPVVVDNRVGAGGIIGIDSVAKSPADGKTFLFTATAFSTLPAIRNDLPYDPIKNFNSVILLGTSPLVFVVNNGVPAKTVREFVDYLSKHQQDGGINYASPGVGSVHHLTTELFLQQIGMQMMHVPYKASANSMSDLVAGHVQAGFVVLQTASQLIQNGKIRLLAVMSNARIAQFPQAPTFIEAGYNLPVINAWFGISAPGNSPIPIISALNSEINQILKLNDVQNSMQKMGLIPAGGGPERLDALIKSELKIWSQVVKKNDINLD